MRSLVLPSVTVAALAACASAQQTSTASSGDRTSSAISSADLRTRVESFAADAMMGRAAGKQGNDVGTDYIARELWRLGLTPAGENGSYSQAVMARRTVQPGGAVTVDGQSFAVWRDFLPRDPRDLGG